MLSIYALALLCIHFYTGACRRKSVHRMMCSVSVAVSISAPYFADSKSVGETAWTAKKIARDEERVARKEECEERQERRLLLQLLARRNTSE